MRIRIAGLLSLATFALALSTASAQATQAGSVTCKDGTASSASGKGACSGHGGVAAAKADIKSGAKADKSDIKSGAKDDKAAGKAATKAGAKADKADTKVAKSDDKAATQVKCTDGTMSKGGRGACSHHGGIAKGSK